MRKSVFVVFAVVALTCLWADSAAAVDESGTVVEDNLPTVHGAIPRGTAERIDPSKMTELTEEGAACIERRKKKFMVGGEHSWVPALPGGEVPVPEGLKPHGPATPPGYLEKRGGNPLTLLLNTDLTEDSNIPLQSIGNVPEPTAILMGDNALYTLNWGAAVSTDGGDNFTYVSPYSGPFANPPGQSFCCDQTSAYDPGTNTAFWLQLYVNGGANPSAGTQRINVDQNADGTWDCHYDITAQMMGWGANRWPDFPDLAVSSNYLWHSSNVFTNTSTYDNAFAARYPLSELSSCAGTLNFDSKISAYFTLRFARGMTTTGYFGALWSNNSIRAYQWPDASAIATLRIGSTAVWDNTGTRACPGPDSRDWCGHHDGRMQSGYVADGVVGFMWVPVQGGSFPFPYTRVARYNESDFSHIDDIDIWSSDVAYVYPSVAVNSVGGLGGTIMWGGGDTYYNNCSVWIADDVNGGTFAPLEHEPSILGTIGPSSNLGGDYTMARMASPDDQRFVGACYANEFQVRPTPMFVYFGRQVVGDPHLFTDGFESGNTTAWSTTTP